MQFHFLIWHGIWLALSYSQDIHNVYFLMFCKTNYQNLAACSELANMCTLILYGKGQSDTPNACTLFLQYATAGQNAAASRTM